MNNFVSARIAAVADAVGAPHQTEAQCKPNLLILFANEPQRELEEVVKTLVIVLDPLRFCSNLQYIERHAILEIETARV